MGCWPAAGVGGRGRAVGGQWPSVVFSCPRRVHPQQALPTGLPATSGDSSLPLASTVTSEIPFLVLFL